MAVGLLRHRCAAQPQLPAEIDWSNPITRKLIIAVNPADGSRNVVNGVALTRSGTIGTTAKGVGKGFSNNGTATNYLQSAVTYGTDITVFAQLQNSAGGSAQNYIDEDDSAGSNRCFQFRQNASNQVEFIRFNSSNSPFTATNTNALTSMLDTGFSAGGMSSGTSVWAWQGRLKSSAATLTGSAHTGTASVRMLASKAASGSNGLNGSAQLLLMWDRCLSDDEYRSIVDNPWQVFRVRPPLYLVLPSTGGLSGTFSAVEPADSPAFSGNVVAPISGTLSATDPVDSASLSGLYANSGSMSVVDGADVAILSGQFISPVSGAFSAVDNADAVAMSGTSFPSGVAGLLQSVDAPDSVAMSGSVTLPSVSGVIAASDASDIVAFAGNVIGPPVVGGIAAHESQDSASFFGSGGKQDSQYYGSGKHYRQLTREEVESQWELLELRQRDAKPKRAKAKPEAEIIVAKKSDAPAVVVASEVPQQADQGNIAQISLPATFGSDHQLEAIKAIKPRPVRDLKRITKVHVSIPDFSANDEDDEAALLAILEVI